MTVSGIPVEDYPTLTPATVTLTATTDTEVVAAPASGISIYVYSIFVANGSPTFTRVDHRESTTVKFSGYAAPNGGGYVLQPAKPWKLAAATNLKVQLGTAPTSGDVRVSVLYRTGP